MKKLIFASLVLTAFLFSTGCHEDHYVKIMGETQGTTYHIIYNKDAMLKPQIDSILSAIDRSVSIFNEQSIISKVNRNEPIELDEHFINIFNKAKEISEATNGSFDITVAPLVEAYGFGSGQRLKSLSQKQIDSMLQFIGYNKIKIKGNKIEKDDPRIQLDMNAIAQGYTVDVIADYFDQLGIRDYLIEVGGEVKAKGKSEAGGPWRIGIDKPIENTDEITRQVELIVGLEGPERAIATSGNYRRFYVENGIKFTHTIDPFTGKPARDSLLSATIISKDCATADGYATACMVVGLKRAIELVENNPKLEAFFIYFNKDGVYKFYFTDGFKRYIIEE